MNDISLLQTIFPIIQKTCTSVICVCIIILAYKRIKGTTITMEEIRLWANNNKNLGKYLYLNRIDKMPKDVSKAAHKEMRTKILINGYKDSSSILATIADNEGKVVKSVFFMGTKLDNDLIAALGDNGLKIEL